jgi:hypothetical protein
MATVASAISAGTERYVVDLARKSLIGKARQRPADVKRVFQKLRQEGILTTITQVSAKLDDPMPLGYSAAGIVLECGAGVQEFKPGDRIAAAAPHSAISLVGRNLCAQMPETVTFEQAAYTSIAAIGLQGVRLAHPGLGESVLVVGLGLIGQICVCLLKAQGYRVFGIDLDPSKLELAHALGADAVATGSPLQAVKDFSGSFGVDAVVLTATYTTDRRNGTTIFFAPKVTTRFRWTAATRCFITGSSSACIGPGPSYCASKTMLTGLSVRASTTAANGIQADAFTGARCSF